MQAEKDNLYVAATTITTADATKVRRFVGKKTVIPKDGVIVISNTISI